METLAIEVGSVYRYTMDGKENWGEGKTDKRTIYDYIAVRKGNGFVTTKYFRRPLDCMNSKRLRFILSELYLETYGK